jgi:hypothetical protein
MRKQKILKEVNMASKKSVSKKRVAHTARVSKYKEREEMERAQVWSVDVLLAVVIFVSVILVFYVTMSKPIKPGMTSLETNAGDLKVELEKNYELGFINKDNIDEQKFLAFLGNSTNNFTGLKKKLGISGNFCIFFEDSDGNIIIISDEAQGISNFTGIGSNETCISGYYCGTTIPC